MLFINIHCSVFLLCLHSNTENLKTAVRTHEFTSFNASDQMITGCYLQHPLDLAFGGDNRSCPPVTGILNSFFFFFFTMEKVLPPAKGN